MKKVKDEELIVKRVRPLYPYVLVKLLKKEQQVGAIILPDKQNKTKHEGIVLDVYRDHTKVVNGKSVVHSPSVRAGDHVLFAHYEGIPVDHVMLGKTYWSGEYRFIPDDPVGNGRNGIEAVLEYSGESTLSDLEDWLEQLYEIDPVMPHWKMAEELLKRAVIVPIDKPSVTRSGS